MDAILIHSFPMPPSHNALYRNVPGVGRVATQELKDYKRECEVYALKNARMFREVRQLIFGKWKDFQSYKIDYYFVFKKERIYTKEGKAKKLDVSNRVKAAQDALCYILGFDDKNIWNSTCEKTCGEVEGVHCVIATHTPLSATELMEMFQEIPQAPKLFS